MSGLRAPADPFAEPSTAHVLEFMEAHGRFYAQNIRDLQASFNAIQAQAGPQAAACAATQRSLDKLDEEIEEIARDAVDRYDDWASDPLE